MGRGEHEDDEAVDFTELQRMDVRLGDGYLNVVHQVNDAVEPIAESHVNHKTFAFCPRIVKRTHLFRPERDSKNSND